MTLEMLSLLASGSVGLSGSSVVCCPVNHTDGALYRVDLRSLTMLHRDVLMQNIWAKPHNAIDGTYQVLLVSYYFYIGPDCALKSGTIGQAQISSNWITRYNSNLNESPILSSVDVLFWLRKTDLSCARVFTNTTTYVDALIAHSKDTEGGDKTAPVSFSALAPVVVRGWRRLGARV